MISEQVVDLLYHIDLATEGIMNCLDIGRDFLPYFECWLRTDPPKLVHTEWDHVDITGRFLYALILSRMVTKKQHQISIERRLRKLLFSSLSEGNGLSYRPNLRKETANSRKHLAHMHELRSVLFALTALIQYEGDKQAKNYANKLVQRLYHLTMKQKGLLALKYYHDGTWYPKDRMVFPPYTSGRNILALIEYFKATQDSLAIDIAEKFVKSNLQCFLEDGAIREIAEYYPELCHFHSISATLAGIIAYGRLIGDQQLVERGKHIYDNPHGLKKYGSSFGWFKENIMISFLKERIYQRFNFAAQGTLHNVYVRYGTVLSQTNLLEFMLIYGLIKKLIQ